MRVDDRGLNDANLNGMRHQAVSRVQVGKIPTSLAVNTRFCSRRKRMRLEKYCSRCWQGSGARIVAPLGKRLVTKPISRICKLVINDNQLQSRLPLSLLPRTQMPTKRRKHFNIFVKYCVAPQTTLALGHDNSADDRLALPSERYVGRSLGKRWMSDELRSGQTCLGLLSSTQLITLQHTPTF